MSEYYHWFLLRILLCRKALRLSHRSYLRKSPKPLVARSCVIRIHRTPTPNRDHFSYRLPSEYISYFKATRDSQSSPQPIWVLCCISSGLRVNRLMSEIPRDFSITYGRVWLRTKTSTTLRWEVCNTMTLNSRRNRTVFLYSLLCFIIVDCHN